VDEFEVTIQISSATPDLLLIQ